MTKLPSHMTAIVIKTPGGAEMLVPEQRAVPAPGDGEILVKVAAAGVNRPDVMQRKGLYPPPPGAPDIPGLEIAGEVVALGANVKRWKLGDRVMALVIGGGYAEYCLAHGTHAMPVSTLPMIEAAGVPENYLTVWHNVFAVSYTHLDVYKRQALICGSIWRISNSRSAAPDACAISPQTWLSSPKPPAANTA